MQAIFISAILLCVATSFVSYQVSQLSWDNSIANFNPIYDIYCFLLIRQQSIKVMNYQLDLE
jgi:hypothetical protein